MHSQATSACNPWLAKSYEKSQSEKKKVEVVAHSSTGSQVQNTPRQGNVKEQLKQDLLKAWAGGAETKVEAKTEEEPPSTACLTGDKDPPGIFQGAWKYPGSWNFPGGLELSRT